MELHSSAVRLAYHNSTDLENLAKLSNAFLYPWLCELPMKFYNAVLSIPVPVTE